MRESCRSSRNIDFTTLATGTGELLGLTSSGGTFTATKTGSINIQTAVANNQNVKVTLNDAQIAFAQSATSTFLWIPINFCVNSGDVVKVTSSDNGGSGQVISGQSRFFPIN